MGTRQIGHDDRPLREGNLSALRALALVGFLWSAGFLVLAGIFRRPAGSEVGLLVSALGWTVFLSYLILAPRLPRTLKAKASLRSQGDDTARSQAIDRLYAELRPLMSRAASDPSLRAEVQAKLDVLRRLQTEEADEMQERFESNLTLKPGEGWQALRQAKALLAKYEDPAASNSPISRQR